MSDRCYQGFAIAVLLLLLTRASLAAGQERQLFMIGGGFAVSGTHARPVSHGHAYLVAGEPGMVFGGVQNEDGKWRFNYLVLIKHDATAASAYHRGKADPNISNASSDGKIRRLHFQEEIGFDERKFAFDYQAQFDAVKDTLLAETMTFQGKKIDLMEGRLFVVDLTAEPVRFQQIAANLPHTEDVHFLKIPTRQYQALMQRWLSELAKESKVVRETFLDRAGEQKTQDQAND